MNQNISNEQLKEIANALAYFNLPERMRSYQYMLLQLGSILKEITQGIDGGNFSYEYVNEKARKLLNEAKSVKQ